MYCQNALALSRATCVPALTLRLVSRIHRTTLTSACTMVTSHSGMQPTGTRQISERWPDAVVLPVKSETFFSLEQPLPEHFATIVWSDDMDLGSDRPSLTVSATPRGYLVTGECRHPARRKLPTSSLMSTRPSGKSIPSAADRPARTGRSHGPNGSAMGSRRVARVVTCGALSTEGSWVSTPPCRPTLHRPRLPFRGTTQRLRRRSSPRLSPARRGRAGRGRRRAGPSRTAAPPAR